jgi:outer membrane lipoprotein carrier protein
MKKTIGIIFLLVVTGLISHSQNNSIGKSDPDAKKFLDEVSVKMKSYKAIQASFTLQLEGAKGNLQGTKKGTVFVKGNKYKLSMTGQEIFCDEKTVWTYDKSSNEVTISKFDPSSSSISAQKLLTDFYDKDYLYKLNGEEKSNGRLVEEIELTPVDKTKNIFKVYVYVDKLAKTILNFKMLDKSGNKYIYTINSFNGKAQINDNSFIFDKASHPGVEEVDLRN